MSVTKVNRRGIEFDVEYTYIEPWEAKGIQSNVLIKSVKHNDNEFIDLLSVVARQEIENLILNQIEG